MNNEINENEYNFQLREVAETTFVFVSAVFEKLWAEWDGSPESMRHYIYNPVLASLDRATKTSYFNQFISSWGRPR